MIDSHTGGEPTRVVISGGPDLGSGRMAERLARASATGTTLPLRRRERAARSDVMVGALLCEPVEPQAAAGVIFFNNVGYLGMCGHGTIGLVVDARPPGPDRARGRTARNARRRRGDRRSKTAAPVSIENVPSYRAAKASPSTSPVCGRYVGDVAWGGNWFFLVQDHGEDLSTWRTSSG